MSIFFRAQKQISGLVLHLIFHRSSLFNCCISVSLELDQGAYLRNSYVVISGLVLHLIFHRSSLFNCCISVSLELDQGAYLRNSYVVFCPNSVLLDLIFVWISLSFSLFWFVCLFVCCCCRLFVC